MKKTTYIGKSKEDLSKALNAKRAELLDFRFGSAGSKTRDVKVGQAIKKDIARIMTELNRKDAGTKK